MDMRARIKEQSDLAHFYAEDGAYHSAARILRELAAEVAAHAERNTELMAQGGGDPKTRALTERARMTDARNDLVTKLADEFEASGIAYTCAAVVHSFAEPRIIALTDEEPYREWRVHSMWSLRRLKTAVADQVHARWKAKNE